MMQLLLAIVQAEDADLLIERLIAQGYRVTRINSVGSFLRRGNATILIGVEEEQIAAVLATMRAVCRSRTTFINATPPVETVAAALPVVMPLEVQIGGALVFGLPVKRFLRLQGGAAPPKVDQLFPSAAEPTIRATRTEGGRMNLILAILANEDADPVVGGLLAAGYRLTRLNTAGGFLRRGNVTLLIGVEPDKVDDVLRIIQANCRLRTEARPAAEGMPMYSATVFVLEAARTEHL
ncbi:MAG: cyclic-di-AMP receptor [Anaerolineae bacterium]|nr:cyclic-di-AMP receptor [Anaerolineae bacterium]